MSNFGAGAQQTGDIPRDYQPIANNFEAPAHSHLNKDQAAEIIRIAEGAHSDTGAAGTGTAGSGSSAGQHLQQARDTLVGGGTGSVTQTHTGQPGSYELGQGDLAHNRTSLTGGDSTSHAGLGAGAGAGAAGLGAGGLAAAAANQGLGNRDQLSSTTGSSADAYGSSSNTPHSSTKDTSSNSGSGPTASHGTLENKLQAELERNAAKKGTHAAGFGTAGMSSDSGNLHSERTGVSSMSGGPASGGMGQSGLAGAGAGATAVGTGAGLTGLSGQHPQTSSIPMPGATGAGQTHGQGQGFESKLAHEVENRAHNATGSDNVTGLGASGVNASHTHGSAASGLGANLGHSTGRAL